MIRELAAIGFSKATDYAEIDGSLVTIKPTSDLTEDQARAIAGIEQGNFGIKIKICDKVKALELLGKHMGMFVDRVLMAEVDESVITEVERMVKDDPE